MTDHPVKGTPEPEIPQARRLSGMRLIFGPDDDVMPFRSAVSRSSDTSQKGSRQATMSVTRSMVGAVRGRRAGGRLWLNRRSRPHERRRKGGALPPGAEDPKQRDRRADGGRTVRRLEGESEPCRRHRHPDAQCSIKARNSSNTDSDLRLGRAPSNG